MSNRHTRKAVQTPSCYHKEIPITCKKYGPFNINNWETVLCSVSTGGMQHSANIILCKSPSKSHWGWGRQEWYCLWWKGLLLRQISNWTWRLRNSSSTDPTMALENDLIDCTDIDSLENSIKDVFNDIILKLKSKDENFIQVVSKFMQRYNKLREGSETCTTIPRIASAIHTFATRHLNSYKTTTKKRLGKRIKVQFTAAGRRRPGIPREWRKHSQAGLERLQKEDWWSRGWWQWWFWSV